MTAQPAGHAPWSPNPIRQRLANHFFEDVLNLPDAAPRVEAADSETELVLTKPFEIKLPIRDITP